MRPSQFLGRETASEREKTRGFTTLVRPSQIQSHFTRLTPPYDYRFRYAYRMDLGYARVSTTHQDLTRQIDALSKLGIPADRIYVDKRTGGSMDREGWLAATEYARDGDVIVAYTLDRIGRSVLAVLQTIADLRARGIGIRTLADPLPVDTSAEASPMAEIAIVMLSLFGQMELTFNRERAAHARAVAAANGTRSGRKSVVDPKKLAYAIHLRDTDHTMAEIATATGLARATLYRHLPPRPILAPTASGTESTAR